MESNFLIYYLRALNENKVAKPFYFYENIINFYFIRHKSEYHTFCVGNHKLNNNPIDCCATNKTMTLLNIKIIFRFY